MANDTSTTTMPPRTPGSPLLVVSRQSRKRPWSAVETTEDTTEASANLEDIKSLILGLYECREPSHLQNLNWYRAFLHPADFNLFITSLDERTRAWFDDKFRCDWINTTGEICVRMSNHAHARFAAGFASLVHNKLSDLRENGATSEEVKQVLAQMRSPIFGAYTAMSKAYGSITDPVTSRRSPDIEFAYAGAKRPALIVEIANAQKNEDLMEVSQLWIQQTRAHIKTVVAVGLKHRTASERKQAAPVMEEALISIVKHSGKDYESKASPLNLVFQTSDPDLQPPGSITLALSDFCPKSVCATHKSLSKVNITITFVELRDILADANAIQADADQSSSSEDESPPPRAHSSRAAKSAAIPLTSNLGARRSARNVGRKRSYEE